VDACERILLGNEKSLHWPVFVVSDTMPPRRPLTVSSARTLPDLRFGPSTCVRSADPVVSLTSRHAALATGAQTSDVHLLWPRLPIRALPHTSTPGPTPDSGCWPRLNPAGASNRARIVEVTWRRSTPSSPVRTPACPSRRRPPTRSHRGDDGIRRSPVDRLPPPGHRVETISLVAVSDTYFSPSQSDAPGRHPLRPPVDPGLHLDDRGQARALLWKRSWRTWDEPDRCHLGTT